MKAMVLKAANTPFVLETLPDPEPGPGGGDGGFFTVPKVVE